MRQIIMDQTPIETVGIGYKPRYHRDLLEERAVGWLEIHAENAMVDGGPVLAALRQMAERYPISCHGVGLSIGAEGPLDSAHLARLRRLLEWLQPTLFSEHLAWSSHGAQYLNDLLPLPYTTDTLQRVCDHIDEVQGALARPMLLENPSSYLSFDSSNWSEPEFLAEIARRTGCGLLLDLNNVFVSAHNLRTRVGDYLDHFALDRVGEIHLAGHHCDDIDPNDPLLIDSHGAPVAEPVWALHRAVLERIGRVPTLIEWDNDLPEWPVLRDEARRAAANVADLRLAEAC